MATLFHYTSLDTFLAICQSKTIRFCELSKSNDSMEGRFVVEALESYMHHIKVPSHINACVVEVLNRFIDMYAYYGICLTSEADDLAQWRAYGNGGRGVAIGFNTDELFKCADASPLSGSTIITEIAYGKEAILPHVEALVEVISTIDGRQPPLFWGDPEKIFRSRKECGDEWDFKKAVEKFSTNCYSIKNPTFAMEKETRITQESTFLWSVGLSFFERSGRIVPYYDVAINDQCIDCIIAGPDTNLRANDIKRVMGATLGTLASNKIYLSSSSSRS